jgi:hypothetical protein
MNKPEISEDLATIFSVMLRASDIGKGYRAGSSQTESVKKALARLHENTKGDPQLENRVRLLSDLITSSPLFDSPLAGSGRKGRVNGGVYNQALIRVEELQEILRASPN